MGPNARNLRGCGRGLGWCDQRACVNCDEAPARTGRLPRSVVWPGASVGVHAVRGGRWCSTRGKVRAGLGAGVLGRWITPSLADEVPTGEPREQRFRALPARLGVYFVLGLCLEAGKPYRAVLKDLTAGLSGVLAAAGGEGP